MRPFLIPKQLLKQNSMKPKEQKMEIHRLMSSTSSIVTLFEVYRNKDYNRLLHRLRNYQSLALFLKAPPLVEFQELEKMHSNLRDIEHSVRQIGLSIDEIAEDCHSLGLNYFADVFENLIEGFRILHDQMVKDAKENLQNNRLEHLKWKRINNTCEECSEVHQAVHLRGLKTSFGMLYPERQQRSLREQFIDQKEEVTLKEKSDFIDHLNSLLQRKTSIANLNINPRKYKELVDCLSKLDKIDKQIVKKVQKKQKNGNIIKDVDQTDQEIQQNYSAIIEQVKNILNSKFREGYSHRIRNMLDKFEIVFKNDHLKRMQRKNMVNVQQQGTQTIPTAENAQLQRVRQEVVTMNAEIAGIKEGRKRIEDKYLKLLQSQRRVSREAMACNAKNEKLLRQLQQRDKIIEQMSHELGRQRTDQIRRYDLFNLRQVQQEEEKTQPALSADSGLNNERRAIVGVNTQVVGRVATEQKHIQTQTEIVSEHGILEPKKKNFKLLNRFSIVNNSSQFIRTFSEQEDKGFKIQQTVTHCIQPTLKIEQEYKPQKTSRRKSEKQKDESKSKEGGKKVKNLSKKNNKKQKQNTNNKTAISKEKFKQDVQYSKPIEALHKQDPDKIIVQRSQKSIQEQQKGFNHSQNKRSSIFTVRDSKRTQKRDSKNMSNIRLTELTQYFRLNHIKTDSSKTKDEAGFMSNTNLNSNAPVNPSPNSIVRINKYQKKTSTTMDRDRVKEIVHLLKVQKETFSKRSAFRPESGAQIDSKPKNVVQLAEQQLRQSEKQEQALAKQDVVETIQNLKMLIESEYTYLKASGFINFLLSFQKKPALVNRNLIKYKFEFTHITQNQLYLFGGVEEMVRFSQNAGIWERYIIDENDLKLYYKHMNFAHKISKYFLLLKKMNQQFFEEYVSFMSDPLNFSLTHFGATVASSINALLSEGEGAVRDILLSNEMNWKKIMMRLIRFHHQSHRNCKHIVEFLDKIGYYRYSI